MLGAGRETAESVIDPRAGILLLKKPGDAVKAGDVIARLLTERAETLAGAADKVKAAVKFADHAVETGKLIYKII